MYIATQAMGTRVRQAVTENKTNLTPAKLNSMQYSCAVSAIRRAKWMDLFFNIRGSRYAC